MNNRIKELAKQATSILSVNHEGYRGKGYIEQVEYFDKEKFAELIVRECSKIIVNGGYRNPALGEKHSLTPPEIATMIQEHFGVKL